MNKSLPDEVEGEVLLDGIISIYILACRERRYKDGCPLPLATSDITNVLNVRPFDMPRWLLDDIIFEIDDSALKDARKTK